MEFDVETVKPVDVDRLLRPTEGFSISHVEVNGMDIFGVRDYVISKNSEVQDVSIISTGTRPVIEIRTGWAQTKDLESGSVVIHMPAKNSWGEPGKLIFTIPLVTDWEMLVYVGGYKRGTEFAYRGTIRSMHGTLDVVYEDDTEKTVHRISTVARPWAGRQSE